MKQAAHEHCGNHLPGLCIVQVCSNPLAPISSKMHARGDDFWWNVLWMSRGGSANGSPPRDHQYIWKISKHRLRAALAQASSLSQMFLQVFLWGASSFLLACGSPLIESSLLRTTAWGAIKQSSSRQTPKGVAHVAWHLGAVVSLMKCEADSSAPLRQHMKYTIYIYICIHMRMGACVCVCVSKFPVLSFSESRFSESVSRFHAFEPGGTYAD